MTLVTLVASLAASLCIHVTAAAADPLPSTQPVSVEADPAKAKNLYFAYKVKITNGIPK